MGLFRKPKSLRLLGKLFNLTYRAATSGMSTTSDGYVRNRSVFGKDKFVHREIAEQVLGRSLRPQEVVHHINGRPSDNRPESLYLRKLTSKALLF